MLVIYTGGTVGMDYDSRTGSLVPFDFEQIMEKVPEVSRFGFNLTVLSFAELIDSSDIQVSHWQTLAKIIEDFYDDFDGFVILHGTDTMAYTASALSFMLENLNKPVILTGAQLPIGATRTDARENLLSAIEIAGTKHNGRPILTEVCIYFNTLLLRGNRAKKVQNFEFTAFKSYNYPPLAVAGIHIEYAQQNFLPYPSLPPRFYYQLETRIALIKLFPGITEAVFRAQLELPELKGVVLETFGSGNAPTVPWLTRSLAEAIERGVIVLNVTQASGGRVKQGKYATSVHLEKIGVIGGGDITTEAAITKMMFLLANYDSTIVKKFLPIPIRGEISN
ncbi:MAG: asparaginase [Flammeovirgaceae bacterium]|nr:asparaginase [Flammeovirgaceae bacterium]